MTAIKLGNRDCIMLVQCDENGVVYGVAGMPGCVRIKDERVAKAFSQSSFSDISDAAENVLYPAYLTAIHNSMAARLHEEHNHTINRSCDLILSCRWATLTSTERGILLQIADVRHLIKPDNRYYGDILSIINCAGRQPKRNVRPADWSSDLNANLTQDREVPSGSLISKKSLMSLLSVMSGLAN